MINGGDPPPPAAPMTALLPPYSIKPSNSVTFGVSLKLMELYFSMVGVTFNTTPTSLKPGCSSGGLTTSKTGFAETRVIPPFHRRLPRVVVEVLEAHNRLDK